MTRGELVFELVLLVLNLAAFTANLVVGNFFFVALNGSLAVGVVIHIAYCHGIRWDNPWKR